MNQREKSEPGLILIMQSKIFNILSGVRLRWKFFIIIISIIMVMGILSTITIMTTMTQALRSQLVGKGNTVTKNLVADSSEPLLVNNLIKLQELVTNVKQTDVDIVYVYILNNQGSVLVHTFAHGFPKGLAETNILAQGHNYHAQLLDTEKGYIHDIAISVLGGYAGSVHVGISEFNIKKAITDTTKILIFMTIGGVIFGVLSALFLGFIIVKPLELLEKGVNEIGKGNFDQQILTRRKDEIGSLANTFNQMTDNLRTIIASRDQQNAFLNNVLDSLSHPFYVINVKDYTIEIANSAAEFSKITKDSTCYALTHGKNKPCHNYKEHPCPLELVKQTKKPVKVEHIHIDKYGQPRNIEIQAYPIFDSDGNLIQMIEYNYDITERKLAEKALAEEKERLSVTLRSIGDGVITTDTNGIIIFLNKMAEKITGWKQEESVGQPLDKIFHIIHQRTRERCKNPVSEVLKSGSLADRSSHITLIAKNNTERSIVDNGAPIYDKEKKLIGVVLVFRDVTEKIKIEKELLKAKKLESVGILAGGIAHDFNNILVAILGNINLATFLVNPEDEIHLLLTEAEKATLRAKNLTLQLLTFSKGGEPIKELSSISEIIKDSSSFVLRGSNVKCNYHIPKDLWHVEIDKGQMSQVIQNIIYNAKHAMPDGGVIDIKCENMVKKEHQYIPLTDEEIIKISITDNGIGISENVLDKIFDPYFSTKQHGSGLGLAITHSIIMRHGGHVSVESKLDNGTTFSIYLAASSKNKQPVARKEVELIKEEGKGKILVMDDEEIVRTTTQKMLSMLGFEVALAKDGEEAINTYKQRMHTASSIDVIILDLTIPGGMGGIETIEKLLQIDPQVRVIVSSGYTEDPVMANYKKYGFSSMINKPFDMKELNEVITKITRGSSKA